MNYPNEVRLYFDTQLVDMYLKDGPEITDPAVTSGAEYVTVVRLVLRSAPYLGPGSANTELPFNFKITAPEAIKDLSLNAITDIVEKISGGGVGFDTFSDDVSVWRVRSIPTNDLDESLTPLSLLLQFAGQTIKIEIQGETYSTAIPTASPSDLSGILMLVAQGYLTFTKQA